MEHTRIERDVLGEVELPENAMYGINTARALENFPLGHKRTAMPLIYAMVTVKKAAALTYARLGVREDGIYQAIAAACDAILAGQYDDAFVTEALQGGAGTSTNMNVNEVIANAALQEAFQHKEQAYEKTYKLGRTELMDAVPMTAGEEFGAYAQALSRDRWRLYKIEERLRMVNLGGTAIGTADTASRQYRYEVIEQLRQLTGIGLAAAEYPVDLTQNNDVFVEVSGLLKALAVNLMKIANDLRLMNSGPHGGIGEIRLPARQQGSSIMPGKVNPVIPEMVMQCAMKVMADDSAIAMAAAHGEFELNAFEPLIADCLLESLRLLIRSVRIFQTACVEGLEVREDSCRQHLQASAAFGAAYIGALGYDTVSRIIKDHEPDEAHRILEAMVKK